MRFSRGELYSGFTWKEWLIRYDEFFHDGWHHILRLGPFWIQWDSWYRMFRKSRSGCDT